MADKKISQLTPATLPLAGTEVLPIVQSGTTDNITVNNLAAGNIKSNATTGVLQVTGPAAASIRVMTTPDASFTVARTDAGQTFTGTQTFSSAISGSVTGTAAGLSSTLAIASGGSNQIAFTGKSGNVAGLVYFDGTSLANDTTVTDVGYDTSTNTVQAKNLTVATTATITNGNLVIGTSGKGIDFSATPQPAGMTSELLADYEEGTFTPQIYTGITSPTYTEQVGRYTKIGNMVYLQIRIILSGGTGSGTQLGISGFPYSAAVAVPNGGAFNCYCDIVSTYITWYIPQSGSSNCLGFLGGGSSATATGSMTGKSVDLNVLYQV